LGEYIKLPIDTPTNIFRPTAADIVPYVVAADVHAVYSYMSVGPTYMPTQQS